MRNTALLAKRELGQFFNTTWGYAIIALILDHIAVIDNLCSHKTMGFQRKEYR